MNSVASFRLPDTSLDAICDMDRLPPCDLAIQSSGDNSRAMRAGDRKIRLCMISDDFLPAATGVGIHVQCISRELTRLGHSVTVITTRRPGQPKFETWNGVHVHRTFTLKMFGFYQALPRQATLRKLIDEACPDIIHYHYLSFLLKGARRIAASKNIPSVYTYHMTADHLTQPLMMRSFRPIIARQIRNFCNTCDLVMAPSDNLAREIVRNGVKVPTAYVSNPIDFDTQPAAVAPTAKRGFTVLFAGRLAPEKNVPYLMDAFAAFARHSPDTELWRAKAVSGGILSVWLGTWPSRIACDSWVT